MMVARMTSALTLRLDAGPDAGPDELELLALRLRHELLALDVEEVRRDGMREAPNGARGIDPGQIGSLLVSLVGAPELLRSVVGLVRDWLGRSRARSVHVEIDGDVLDVTGVSSADQDRLIEAWLSRRTAS